MSLLHRLDLCSLCVNTVEKQECSCAVILIYLFCTLCLLPLHLILVVSGLSALVTDYLSIPACYLEYFESDLWNNNAKVISPNIYKIERTLCSLRGVA